MEWTTVFFDWDSWGNMSWNAHLIMDLNMQGCAAEKVSCLIAWHVSVSCRVLKFQAKRFAQFRTRRCCAMGCRHATGGTQRSKGRSKSGSNNSAQQTEPGGLGIWRHDTFASRYPHFAVPSALYFALLVVDYWHISILAFDQLQDFVSEDIQFLWIKNAYMQIMWLSGLDT